MSSSSRILKPALNWLTRMILRSRSFLEFRHNGGQLKKRPAPCNVGYAWERPSSSYGSRALVEWYGISNYNSQANSSGLMLWWSQQNTWIIEFCERRSEPVCNKFKNSLIPSTLSYAKSSSCSTDFLTTYKRKLWQPGEYALLLIRHNLHWLYRYSLVVVMAASAKEITHDWH